jgi:hypothetical protein
VKSAHLEKIEARRRRVLQLLLPDEVPRGETGDPEDRLRELVKRLGGRDVLGPGFPLRTAVENVRDLLETDIPELMDAVRAANARNARCRYCGEGYQPLLVIAALEDPDRPGGWQCRDVDGCEARMMRAGETVIPAEAAAAPASPAGPRAGGSECR